jgi:hypothetical protein
VHRYESVPTTWDAERDATFFRVVQAALSARYLEIASLLLMTNEPDTAGTATS